MRRVTIIVVASALCAGCFGSVLKSGVEPPDLYRLDLPGAVAGGTALSLAISVSRPRAPESLDTSRIAVVKPGNGFDYVADARWSDPAPQVVQQLLVDALGAPGRFAAAAAAPSHLPADLLLETSLRRFEAVYADVAAAPTVVVELRASLLDVRKGTRLASFDSRAEVAAARNDRTAVVAAFEQAAARAVEDVAERVRAAAAAR